jgi:hypothetical protein
MTDHMDVSAPTGADQTDAYPTYYRTPDRFAAEVHVQGPNQDQTYHASFSGPAKFVADTIARFTDSFEEDTARRMAEGDALAARRETQESAVRG